MAMELSVWSQYYHDKTPEWAVEEFLKDGITTSELSDEHGLMLLERDADVVKTGRAFRAFLEEKGFRMTQGHLWLGVKLVGDPSAVPVLCRWIDLYEAIGIKNMVLHRDALRDSGLGKEERMAKNVEKLKLLAEHVKDKDVYICLENLKDPTPECLGKLCDGVDDLLKMVEMVGSDRFGICLDTGHLNITEKDQRYFITKAGKHLRALHIAQNDGTKDQHIMPFGRGDVDFFEVVRALRDVGYEGIFNLEIPGENRIPLALRHEKMKFIKAAYAYLMENA